MEGWNTTEFHTDRRIYLLAARLVQYAVKRSGHSQVKILFNFLFSMLPAYPALSDKTDNPLNSG
jgi:hypothetical protein